VTGVQTCALPIFDQEALADGSLISRRSNGANGVFEHRSGRHGTNRLRREIGTDRCGLAWFPHTQRVSFSVLTGRGVSWQGRCRVPQESEECKKPGHSRFDGPLRPQTGYFLLADRPNESTAAILRRLPASGREQKGHPSPLVPCDSKAAVRGKQHHSPLTAAWTGNLLCAGAEFRRRSAIGAPRGGWNGLLLAYDGS
jgi:hypothetical protein